jgi:glyoxylase-like metal-dependent hydrolase (beta-lactamase superfamily II)
MSEYTIRPINTGYLVIDRATVVLHDSVHRFFDVNGTITVPVMAYLVEGNGHKLLIDTGMADTATADTIHCPGSVQPPGFAIHEQLENLNIPPDDIDSVILTHLHWDHCYNVDKFRKAKLYAQRIEYQAARDPIPLYERIYEHPKRGRRQPFGGMDSQFVLLDGEKEIFPGINVYPTPGHSAGHQAVAVKTPEGVFHCCGDLIHGYYNLRPQPEIGFDVSPPARYENMAAHWQSLRLLKKLAGDTKFILPAHELEMETYYKNGRVIGKK